MKNVGREDVEQRIGVTISQSNEIKKENLVTKLYRGTVEKNII